MTHTNRLHRPPPLAEYVPGRSSRLHLAGQTAAWGSGPCPPAAATQLIAYALTNMATLGLDRNDRRTGGRLRASRACGRADGIPSGPRGCARRYATDQGSYVATGWRSSTSETIEIPHLSTGFAEPRTFIGTALTDTGRGTFTLSGRPITDDKTLSQLDLADDEAAIEVPKSKRTFYGASTAG